MRIHANHSRWWLGMAVALTSFSTANANVDIANAPLFLSTSVDPNIMFIIDDSGSMFWSFMPDGIFGQWNTDRAKSSTFNRVYYDPQVEYKRPLDHNGDPLPEPDFNNAWMDGYAQYRGDSTPTVDLSSSFRPTWYYSGTYFYAGGAEPAYYYTFDHAGCDINNGSDVNNDSCYDKVVVDDSSGPGGVDERQNFANWYSYYRSRLYASRAGIGAAFADLPSDFRLGWGRINKGWSDIDGVNVRAIQQGVRPLAPDHKEGFYDWLYDVPASGGTPLRRALDGAGRYLESTDSRGPWSTTPGQSGGEDLECRQSYTILMTDGFWNGWNPSGIGNADGSDGPSISAPDGTTYQYSAEDPYQDSRSNTLADVAMHYWKRDLRTDLGNRVPTYAGNEAFWQHMVTFGVGLGVEGDQDPEDVWEAVEDGTPISWGNPFSSDSAKIDDLLHASVNSRGGFFSAQDPDTFATELSSILEDIIGRAEDSAASAAVSSAILQPDSLLYSVGFLSDDWSGSVEALSLGDNGEIDGTEWDAAQQLASRTPSSRELFTTNSDSGDGVTLELGALSTGQQDALDRDSDGDVDGLASTRLQWIRGEEDSALRSRDESGQLRLLGDIINADPQFMDRRDFGYALLDGVEGDRYLQFRQESDYQDRPDVLFAAANDGLLHAFHAGETSEGGGHELFAYMPSELLLPKAGDSVAVINQLMEPDYSHLYFHDGTPTIGDAHWDNPNWSNNWGTVLVGTMGVGGRTVYALDVTDPEGFTSDKVLWEFTDEDLGHGVTDAQIVRMANGEWAAVFGNGYNSDNHEAVLYIVRLRDGALIKKIQTGVGDATNPNGLGPVATTDWPNLSLTTNRIYAGDLQGNVWRFNVSSSNTNQWDEELLFQAVDSATGDPQPITVQPRLAADPLDSDALMVLFGTGSYFRSSDDDLPDPQVQSLYGIQDTKAGHQVDRSDLLTQEITFQGDASFNGNNYTIRQISNHVRSGENGWVMDLEYGGQLTGERVISRASFPAGTGQNRVRFSTLIPDEDPCGIGRTGFLMDISIADGGAYAEPVFDLSQDGSFDDDDLFGDEPFSGLQSGGGEEHVGIVDPANPDVEYLYEGNPSGGSGSGGGGPVSGATDGYQAGRHSWQQIR